MKAFFSRGLCVILLLTITLSAVSAANSSTSSLPGMVTDYQASIDKAMSAKNYEEAIKLSQRLREALPQIEGLNKEQINEIANSLYRKPLRTAYENLGLYQQAAAAIRSASVISRQSSDVKTVIDLSTTAKRQQEYFNLRYEFNKQRAGLVERQLPLVREKQDIINRFNKAGKFDEKSIAALKAKLGKLENSIQELAAQEKKISADFEKKVSKLLKPPFNMTNQQEKVLGSQEQTHRKLVAARNSAQASVNKAFSEIVQNYQVSWKGLAKNLKALAGIQKEIMGLRARLEALSKPPVTKDKLTAAKKLVGQLEKLRREESRLYSEIEKAFMDQKVFDKLKPAEQEKLLSQFNDVWLNHEKLSNPPTIKDLYYAVEKAYQAGLVHVMPSIREVTAQLAQIKSNKDKLYYIYEAVLNRNPDEKGFAYWLNKMEQESYTIEDILPSFYSSIEAIGNHLQNSRKITEQVNQFKSNADKISFLYQNILDRMPEPAGLKYWMEQLRSGKSIEQIITAMYSSKEFKSKYVINFGQTLEDCKKINSAYVEMTRREATDEELLKWIEVIKDNPKAQSNVTQYVIDQLRNERYTTQGETEVEPVDATDQETGTKVNIEEQNNDQQAPANLMNSF